MRRPPERPLDPLPTLKLKLSVVILAGLGIAIIPRRVARYLQERKLRRLHPALPFVADEIHLLFRGDAHRTRAFVITKDAIVAHGRALDCDYEE